MGYVSHKMVGIALAIQYNVPFVSLAALTLDPELRRLVPASFAFHWQVLPLGVEVGVLTVAVADPAETDYKDELRRSTRLAIAEVVATSQELGRTIMEFYRDQGGDPAAG
jgi:type IV pilus assembly protein PilB